MVALVDALRAVCDANTNQGGLKTFCKRLDKGGAAFLAEYLKFSTGFDELHKIWDHQQTVRPCTCRSAALTIASWRMHACMLVASQIDGVSASVKGTRARYSRRCKGGDVHTSGIGAASAARSSVQAVSQSLLQWRQWNGRFYFSKSARVPARQCFHTLYR